MGMLSLAINGLTQSSNRIEHHVSIRNDQPDKDMRKTRIQNKRRDPSV
jgi:hypothetical protein